MSRIVALVLALAPAVPAAAQTIPVSVGGNASSLVGVDFTVPLEVDLSARAEKLGAIALRLSWDPAVLAFIGGSPGAFGDITVNDDSLAAGVIRLSGANPGGTGGRFTLAQAHLRPLVAGTTDLTLAVTEFYAAGTFADLLPSVVATGRQYCPARGRWGDLDGDGAANSRDALITLSAAVGIPIGGFDAGLGDVNADGATGALDALIILSYSVGLNVAGFRLFAVAPGACGVDIAALGLDPAAVTLLTGQAVDFVALASDGAGAALAVTDVFWHTSDADVVTVGPSGAAIAVGVGTALVTAVRSGGPDTATATVTVVADRTVHWVSALAGTARNQLGTSAVPFGTIQRAVDFATPGDTIRVLPGRYVEALMLHRPVTVWGDTAGGAAPPLIGDVGKFQAVSIESGGLVELHNVRIDTTRRAVHVLSGDSVRLRNLFYRGPYFADVGIAVDQGRDVRIERARLYGALDYYYSSDGIRASGDVETLVVDSSEVSGWGYHGVAFYGGDSLHLRGSRITDNAYLGLYAQAPDSTRAFAATLVGNRISRNIYGQVNFYLPRAVRMEHNVLSGGGGFYYDLLTWNGYAQSTLSLLGDSLVATGGEWIYGQRYDSLLMDSVYAEVRDSYGYLYQGRHTLIRNSRITGVTYSGLDYYGYSDLAGARLELENTVIEGPAVSTCHHCGEGLDVDYAHTSLTDVTFTNLYRAVTSYDSSLTVMRGSITDVQYGLYMACGSLVVDSTIVTDVEWYGIEAYGCDLPDSVWVNAASVDSRYRALYASTIRGTVRNSMLSSPSYPLYWSVGSGARTATVSGNTVGSGTGEAVYVSVPDTAGTADVRANNVQCVVGTSTTYGLRVDGAGALTVAGNTVTDCGRRGGSAIYLTSTRAARVDSNVVRNPGGLGLYLFQGTTLQARGNDIVDTVSAPCCGTHGAMVHVGRSGATLAELLDNRVRGSGTHGIVLRRGTTSDTTHVRVERNVVRGVDSLGFWVTEYAKTDAFNNTLDSSGLDAMRIDRFDNDTTSVRVHQNNFTRSGRYGLAHADAWVVDATNNWWGDALGPSGAFGDTTGQSTGDSVTSNVVWDPWLTAPAVGAPLSAPPAFFAAAAWAPARPVLPRGPAVSAVPRPAPRAERPAPPVRAVPGRLPDVITAWRAAAEARRTALRPERRRP